MGCYGTTPKRADDRCSRERRHRARGVDILLHGHTHRPNIHFVELGDRVAKRIVLGDWYEQGSIARISQQGIQLENRCFNTPSSASERH